MKLRKVEFSDWQNLLAWRNDIVTRKNCEVDDFVEEENHKKWLAYALKNENLLYFVAIENNTAVGTIRGEFSPETNSYKVSWTTAPEHRNKGFAKKMAALLFKEVKETIKVEIRIEDFYSVRIAEHLGMTFQKEFNGKKYYSINP